MRINFPAILRVVKIVGVVLSITGDAGQRIASAVDAENKRLP